MRKYLKVFIIFALTVYLLVRNDNFSYSQGKNLNNSDCNNPKAVCLNEQFIFSIKNDKPVGDLTPLKRATIVRKRIKKIADSYVEVDGSNSDLLEQMN